MDSKKEPALKIISFGLEDLAEGQRRIFLNYSKSEYDIGKPIFLEDKDRNVLGAVVIERYDFFERFARGRYKVLKLFSEEDMRQLIELFRRPPADLFA